MTASVPEMSKQNGRPQARFPRSLRLLRHADFERVYKQGRRHFSTSMTVFYMPRPETLRPDASAGLRVGFTVGRALGGAVHRNRMKRRLREAVRLSHPPTKLNVDVVINPKKSLLNTDFETVCEEVRRALTVVEQKVTTLPAANKDHNSSRPPGASDSSPALPAPDTNNKKRTRSRRDA